jgi:hypothetical protein
MKPTRVGNRETFDGIGTGNCHSWLLLALPKEESSCVLLLDGMKLVTGQ